MKVAIMQPYFFPYIGYFQLINAVDAFVIYDDIEYVKQSWINRNRILLNDQASYISLPLKKDSNYLPIKERVLADSWAKDRKKLLQRISGTYKKAPNYEDIRSLLEQVVNQEETNLFHFLDTGIKTVLDYLEIKTPVITSTNLGDFSKFKSQAKVIEICKALDSDTYINPIGGLALYDKSEFQQQGIELQFIKARETPYKQFTGEFVPFLSIIDVLMFNDQEQAQQLLLTYDAL